MVEAASSESELRPIRPEALRVPASTIRAIRLYHGWSREQMADSFKLDVRTVYRWEYYGVRIDLIKLDPTAHPNSGPEWRRKLLICLLERYQSTTVSDNRNSTGQLHVLTEERNGAERLQQGPRE